MEVFDISLYDYLGDERVQLFYSPIIYKEKIAYLGGNFLKFNKGDKLPLKTLYYQYPDNFIVYHNRTSEKIISIIKNGVFLKTKYLKEISTTDLTELIVDIKGTPLNINKVSDFKIIHENKVFATNTDILSKTFGEYLYMLSEYTMSGCDKTDNINYIKNKIKYILDTDKSILDRYCNWINNSIYSSLARFIVANVNLI
ncbi:TPA: hypothetical protein N2D99_002217 [Clostridium botulinum]|nr:hypothetical protein [Clostridium botulinum]